MNFNSATGDAASAAAAAAAAEVRGPLHSQAVMLLLLLSY